MKIYTVSELNALVHGLLEESLPELWVEGEISNARSYPSGHAYFTLKDKDSQIAAVLFRGYAAGLKFKPADGLKVLARGRVSTYLKRGEVQLVVSALEPKEKGALQVAFEQLKAKLEKEGLFDPSRKKGLPPFPRTVGVVTSLQGAAVRDILSVLHRRWSGLHVLIAPVSVQGDGAKGEIARAIQDFNAHFPETDVLLVGRGGGSLEDLWAFNEESVARAIAASRIPVISCVGHETDFTIADFVADRRAPTPSAAAEMAVPEKDAVLSGLAVLQKDLSSAMRGMLGRISERLGALARHPLLQSPRRMYEERARRADELAFRIEAAMRRALENSERAIVLCARGLEALSPLKVLSRGYAVAESWPGRKVLRAAREAPAGSSVRVRLKEGAIYCEVTHGEDAEKTVV